MPSGDGILPNHIEIELLSDEELDNRCNYNGDDDDRNRAASLVVGGTFLHSLLDNDSRFPAVVALEVRGEVPSARPDDCKSLLASPWGKLQTLTGWNDALCHISSRKLLRVPKLVVRLALNASTSEASATFHRNVAAFQPDTLTVKISCTDWPEWHSLEDLLAALFTVDSLLGVRKLYLTLSLPLSANPNLEDASGLDTPDNPSTDMYIDASELRYTRGCACEGGCGN